MNATTETKGETMKSMTHAEWAARVAARQDVYGSDCWTPDHIWRQIFRDARVTRASVPYVGTGLWADVNVTFADGTRATRRVFG